MHTCNAESQKNPILKKLTGLCPSKGYYIHYDMWKHCGLSFAVRLQFASTGVGRGSLDIAKNNQLLSSPCGFEQNHRYLSSFKSDKVRLKLLLLFMNDTYKITWAVFAYAVTMKFSKTPKNV